MNTTTHTHPPPNTPRRGVPPACRALRPPSPSPFLSSRPHRSKEYKPSDCSPPTEDPDNDPEKMDFGSKEAFTRLLKQKHVRVLRAEWEGEGAAGGGLRRL